MTCGASLRMGVTSYDPKLGRFLEVDPIEGGSCNDYDYVCGDPVNYVDLSGECFWDGCALEVALGVAIGGTLICYATHCAEKAAHGMVDAAAAAAESARRLVESRSGDSNKSQRDRIRDRDGHVCQDCGQHTPAPQGRTPRGGTVPRNQSEIHHDPPLRRSGRSVDEELTNLCRSCHQDRHRR
ncbi:MAG: hypothetical protein JWO88_3655 [Frankiales bacterium]|nr:hypothetical protein [Frankiales bacterium]